MTKNLKKSFVSKAKLRWTINSCRRVLEAAKLAYANKTKSLTFPRNQAIMAFGKYLIFILLNKAKSAMASVLNGSEVFSSASDKAVVVKSMVIIFLLIWKFAMQ